MHVQQISSGNCRALVFDYFHPLDEPPFFARNQCNPALDCALGEAGHGYDPAETRFGGAFLNNGHFMLPYANHTY